MEREGKKEAEERKSKAEDEAASRGMQMFLGCGKRMEDGQKTSRTKAITLRSTESDGMTCGRTQEIVPPKNDLSSLTCGGKRILEGGLDSPNKRARKYGDLKVFWGGGGVAAPNSSSVSSNNILTSFVHAPKGPGEKWNLSSKMESDKDLTDLGLTGEDRRK